MPNLIEFLDETNKYNVIVVYDSVELEIWSITVVSQIVQFQKNRTPDD